MVAKSIYIFFNKGVTYLFLYFQEVFIVGSYDHIKPKIKYYFFTNLLQTHADKKLI